MLRTYILLVFTFFFLHLHASGNITKYINMKYAYLSYIAIFIFAILTVIQAYTDIKQSDEKHNESCCDGEHIDERTKPFYQRWFIYGVFIFPLVTGFFLPIATLDSTIVKSKGFTFKAIETTEKYAVTQYLKPDTSIYYGKEGYDELMEIEKNKYLSKKSIVLKDADYLKGLETIYKYPGDFLGKTIEFDGFAFKGETVNKRQLFVLRFGIIHCVADSGVFGMLVEFPKDIDIKDDEWIHVKGTISSVYYQPFKSTIPVLLVKDWEITKEPKEPYVYKSN
jgi:putative membrane protein